MRLAIYGDWPDEYISGSGPREQVNTHENIVSSLDNIREEDGDRSETTMMLDKSARSVRRRLLAP